MKKQVKTSQRALRVGDVVCNTFSGDLGTVDRVGLSSQIGDCVIVRFHDRNGHPQGDGLSIPRKQLEFVR